MPRADPTVRRLLIEKLGGISRQALSARVQALKKQLPLSTPDALYVLAHQNGVKIDRYLEAETLARVRDHVGALDRLSSPPRAVNRAPVPPKRGARTPSAVTLRVRDFDNVPGMTPQHVQDAQRMAEVYPVLYVFENSARDLIDRVLTAKLGKDWWDSIAPPRLKRLVEGRKATEGHEAWHSRRGASEIHYVDLGDLPTLVKHADAWPHLRELFAGRQTWFESIVDDLNVSRRVIAHMNPLSADDVKQVEAGFRRWTKQISARQHLIP